MSMAATRRELLRYTAAGAAIAVSGCAHASAGSPGQRVASTSASTARASSNAGAIPRRRFGKYADEVSVIGIGGSHLGEAPDENEAIRIVHEAIDAGINFFDNAWEYHDGKSEEILGKALVGKRDRVFLMTKVCTHGRDAKVAMQQLDESLKRLKTDHLDLWQVHECIHDNDPELHYAPGGVLEALTKAKQQGKVRYVGFTGHKDPNIHLAMIQKGYAFDSAQMPLNAFDGSFRSFEQHVVPVASSKGMAVIGMKSMGGNGQPVKAGVVGPEEALRYAMSVPGVTTTVSGIDSIDILRQNLAVARGFTPMTSEEMARVRQRVAATAGDGHFELYKTTMHYDAKVGREVHGFPSMDEVPL